MSTRATYQINDTTLYIHHDGYPEGAAEYFSQGLALYDLLRADPDQRSRGLCECFIIANQGAEITPSHNTHGDTEYRYTVTGKDLKVERRRMSSDTWHPTYTGTLLDFVARYTEGES